MMPRHFLLFLAILVALLPGAAPAAKPLNLLLLYADDWRHDTLGCAGHPVVQTPHLDQLAAEGIRFTQNCVTTSICGVSRASLYTGQWMSRHGNRGFKMFRTPWEQTFPALLRQHGYHTGQVGKWHNGDFPKDRFDFGTAYHGKHWYTQEDGTRVHVTTRNEQDALEFLRERPQDRPFLLTVSFFATHAQDGHPDQFLPQPQSMSLYDGRRIPVPVNATQASWERLPDFFDEDNEGRNRWRWRFDTPQKYQHMMRNYFRLASEVDATCGKILSELEKQGVAGETLVIFTTDNGYYHGEHGLADKWYPHQESIRVPLILRDPRMRPTQAGTTDAAMTLNVDLAPTLLAAAGLPVPDGMQGRDLARLYLDPTRPAWRDEFFYEHPTLNGPDFIPASEALVRRDWKYLYWPEADLEQLFDLQADPHEEVDLADHPAQQKRLAVMRTRFRQLKRQAR